MIIYFICIKNPVEMNICLNMKINSTKQLVEMIKKLDILYFKSSIPFYQDLRFENIEIISSKSYNSTWTNTVVKNLNKKEIIQFENDNLISSNLNCEKIEFRDNKIILL